MSGGSDFGAGGVEFVLSTAKAVRNPSNESLPSSGLNRDGSITNLNGLDTGFVSPAQIVQYKTTPDLPKFGVLNPGVDQYNYAPYHDGVQVRHLIAQRVLSSWFPIKGTPAAGNGWSSTPPDGNSGKLPQPIVQVGDDGYGNPKITVQAPTGSEGVTLGS